MKQTEVSNNMLNIPVHQSVEEYWFNYICKYIYFV